MSTGSKELEEKLARRCQINADKSGEKGLAGLNKNYRSIYAGTYLGVDNYRSNKKTGFSFKFDKKLNFSKARFR